MFDQSLSLIQPGGAFNVTWISGDPTKKRLTQKVKKMMGLRDLELVLSQLQPFIFNLKDGVQYNVTLALPLNVAHRLLFGVLKHISSYLDDVDKSIRNLTNVEIRLLQRQGRLEVSGLQLSRILLEDDDESDRIEETTVRRKRRNRNRLFDDEDVDEIFNEHIYLNFEDLQIHDSVVESRGNVSEYSRFTKIIGQLEKHGDRQKRKREFTELFDVISEVGMTNRHVIEVAREAFSANPLLSEAFQKRISGTVEGLEECYDMILDNKAAQTEFYLQKLKLVDQNVINEECIAQVSRRSGKNFSIKANNTIPSDIYTELVSIAQGKSTLHIPHSTFHTNREESHGQIDAIIPGFEGMSFGLETSKPNLEEPSVLLFEQEPSIEHQTTIPEVPQPVIATEYQVEEEAAPVIVQPTRRRRAPRASRPRQSHRQPPSSLDTVLSMKTLEEIYRYFRGKGVISSTKITRRIKNISIACENFVNNLVKKQKNLNGKECIESEFWFKNLEDISKEVYTNNGCLVDMFKKLESFPFVYKEDGFTIESKYKNELKKILNCLKTSEINYGLYSAIIDMPIIGLSINPYNREIIEKWICIFGLDKSPLEETPFSDHTEPGGKIYSFLPKFLPKSFMYPDFTNSLRTLTHPYEKLRYPFLKMIGHGRDLYLRNHKMLSKKIKKFVRNDYGSWDFKKDIKIIEKMIKDVILSDNVLTSKFHNVQSSDNRRGVRKEVVNTFSYNPNGTIGWSDLILFVDFLFKTYCESTDGECVESDIITQFVKEVYNPPECKDCINEVFQPVEFESRLDEINNSLAAVYSDPENYFYKKFNEDVNSRFESLMPTILEDETAVFDEVDMSDIIDELNDFQLELSFGYIPPQIEPQQESQEEETFANIERIYSSYNNNKEDLKTKPIGDTQLLVPSKWDEMLTNYLRSDRKRPRAESSFSKEKSKRQRVNSIPPTIPEEDLPVIEGEGEPEEVPTLSQIEEVRHVSNLPQVKSMSSTGSLLFKTLHDIDDDTLSQFTEGSITFKNINETFCQIESEPNENETLLNEIPILLSPINENQEKKWGDTTLLPPEPFHEQHIPEFSETSLPLPAVEIDAINEKRKEVGELLKRCDIVPEYNFTFSINKFGFYDENKNVMTSDEYLKNAARQIGLNDLLIEDDDMTSDCDSIPENVNLFEGINLRNCNETSKDTYEKAKKFADDSGKTTFKKLVGDTPTRATVAKTFYNTVLLGRGKKSLAIVQKDLDDIKIMVKDPPNL